MAAALSHAGVFPQDVPPKEAFFVAANFLAMPGVFGLIMAALTAALMSTVDTLITAIAAIVVNDVYKPLRPDASDKTLLGLPGFHRSASPCWVWHWCRSSRALGAFTPRMARSRRR